MNADETPVRNTRQRSAVLDALSATDEFRSAQQLHDELRHAGVRVGLATVYRTLQTLADAGQVDTLRTAEGEVHYRQCAATEHHHHLVCVSCGKTVELSADAVEAWAAQVAASYGFRDVSHHLELFGTCSDC